MPRTITIDWPWKWRVFKRNHGQRFHKNTFCRVIELDEHQVLLMKTFPEQQEDSYEVEIHTIINGYIATKITAGFETEAEQDDMFRNYSRKEAEEHIEFVKGSIQ